MRTSPRFQRHWRPFGCLAVLALTLGACGRSAAPVAPAQERAIARTGTEDAAAALSAAEGGFYPLEVGNHWSYERAIALFTIPVDGPPGPVFGSRHPVDRDLVCVEQIGDQRYVVEQNGAPATPPWWVRYRQDGAGLYEADVTVALPPACLGATGRRAFETGAASARPGEASWSALAARSADPARQVAYRAAWERLETRAAAIRQVIGAARRAPADARHGGAQPGEITRLEYPLHPGAHWVIRGQPSFEATAEANEVLDLPPGRMPAWRIRIDSEFLGANDHVHVWYGRSGFLKYAAHFEGVATDPAGNPVGTVVADETEDLLELSLNRGRFATR